MIISRPSTCLSMTVAPMNFTGTEQRANRISESWPAHSERMEMMTARVSRDAVIVRWSGPQWVEASPVTPRLRVHQPHSYGFQPSRDRGSRSTSVSASGTRAG